MRSILYTVNHASNQFQSVVLDISAIRFYHEHNFYEIRGILHDMKSRDTGKMLICWLWWVKCWLENADSSCWLVGKMLILEMLIRKIKSIRKMKSFPFFLVQIKSYIIKSSPYKVLMFQCSFTTITNAFFFLVDSPTQVIRYHLGHFSHWIHLMLPVDFSPFLEGGYATEQK